MNASPVAIAGHRRSGAHGERGARPRRRRRQARVTRTSEGFARDHAGDELRDPKSFQTTRRAPADVVQKPRIAVTAKAFSSTQSAYGDTYVYDATTDLFSDHDGDGYFHHLRVRLDADTLFASSVVYAEIYVSADGNAWELLYTTKDFTVWGSDPNDDYEARGRSRVGLLDRTVRRADRAARRSRRHSARRIWPERVTAVLATSRSRTAHATAWSHSRPIPTAMAVAAPCRGSRCRACSARWR